MRKQFYEKALPSQGVYCITGIRDKVVNNRFAETLDDLHTIIDEMVGEQLNVFVALSTFNNYSRKADNALYTRSFFIDLDVGDNKGYASKQHALEELNLFVDRTGLPPPVRVDSGTGIHAYWFFDDDIPTAEWKPYADKFKAFCRDNRMYIDPVVTGDSARILRCPDTYNYKTDPPTATRLLDQEFPQYSFKEFKEFLGEDVEVDIFAGVERGLDEDTLKIAKLDNFETLFQTIAENSLADQGCNQIKNILINSATLSEPLWHSGLSIARHCADWETAIHLMSEDHPGYNRETTIRKANETLDKPHSCKTFEDRNPGGCEGCPFRGKITNPLSIGRRLIEQPPLPEAVEADAVRQNEDTEAVPVFPAFLKPFVRGVNGGVYFVPPPKKDAEGKTHQDDPVCLSINDLYPTKRIYHRTQGESLLCRYVLPKDPPREFLLPLRNIASQEEMMKILADAGLITVKSDLPKMVAYWKKWAQYMQSINTAEQLRMQMGWTESKDAFVIGMREITSTGDIVPAAASPLVRNVAKLLVPNGTYERWKESANLLNTPSLEVHAFVMLCGFGSTLMHLTPTSGASISLVSEGSGHGKTGAMYAAISPWGNPKELSVQDKSSTDNGLQGRFLNLKNIPMGLDEATNADASELSTLIHKISQGKAKIRMQSSVNAERDVEETASMIAVFTGNTSIYDRIQNAKKAAQGEIARVLEFVLKKPKALQEDPTLGVHIFNGLRENYGHAGPEFIQYIYKVGLTHVAKLMRKWQVKFKQDFGDDSAYRFYDSMVTVAFTAGELCNEADILAYDLDRIYEETMAELIMIRDKTVKTVPADYKSILGEFINKNQHNFLVMKDGRVTSEPRMELVGRAEVDEGMRYISKTIFKQFLAERQVSVREFEFAMQKENILTFNSKKRLASGWKAGTNGPGIYVYGFKTDPKELIDESAED